MTYNKIYLVFLKYNNYQNHHYKTTSNNKN